MRIILGIIIGTLLWPAVSFAQTMQYFHVQSGTGFFVNRQYIITNAHVVNGCSKVIIKGAVPEREATVTVMDADHDLALIETNTPPQEFAPLRINIDALHTGDKVLVIGYPGEAGAHGTYRVAEAQVVDLMRDPSGSPERFFISDVVEHGNSGGPVFDTSGNVIGVVVAKTIMTITNAATNEKVGEQHAGVVISLATLKQFLFDHGVYTEWSGSGLLYADSYIEEHAKDYIVNVQCRMPAAAPGNVGAGR